MIDISFTALHAWLDKDYRSPGMLLAGCVWGGIIYHLSIHQKVPFKGGNQGDTVC